jgi:hypothetical protein
VLGFLLRGGRRLYPNASGEIELTRRRSTNFTFPCAGQQQKPENHCSLPIAKTVECRRKTGQFGTSEITVARRLKILGTPDAGFPSRHPHFPASRKKRDKSITA